MSTKTSSTFLIIMFTIFCQCSRTCGEGMRYKQVECKKILANGTEVVSSDCMMEQIPDLIKPCHNPPCGKWQFTFVFISVSNLTQFFCHRLIFAQSFNKFRILATYFLRKSVVCPKIFITEWCYVRLWLWDFVVTAIGAPGASKRNLKGLGAGTVIMKNTGTRVLGSRKHTYLAEGEMLGNPMILKCRDYSSFLWCKDGEKP